MANRQDYAYLTDEEYQKGVLDREQKTASVNSDYSRAGATERERRAQEVVAGHIVGGEDPEDAERRRPYVNPGAADYGGSPDAAGFYRDAARGGMTNNDPEQAAAMGGLASAYAAMTGNRGPQATENPFLAGREASARKEQLGGLGLLRDQAMGLAPSEAAFQTRLANNDIGGQYAGQAGGARGLTALSGAQMGGAAGAGAAGTQAGLAGAMGRSNEVGSAIAQYGKSSGQVAGQDLTRLGIGNQMSQFNSGLNNDWKLGNAQLYNQWGDLANKLEGQDQRWFGASMAPADIQFGMDQEAAGWQAGQSAEQAALAIEKDRDRRQQLQNTIGGVAQAGLTAIGSLAGPAGAAAGGMAGSAINSATKKYY